MFVCLFLSCVITPYMYLVSCLTPRYYMKTFDMVDGSCVFLSPLTPHNGDNHDLIFMNLRIPHLCWPSRGNQYRFCIQLNSVKGYL